MACRRARHEAPRVGAHDAPALRATSQLDHLEARTVAAIIRCGVATVGGKCGAMLGTELTPTTSAAGLRAAPERTLGESAAAEKQSTRET
jgi:hypothetical protein